MGLTCLDCFEIEEERGFIPFEHDETLSARLMPGWETPGFSSKIRLPNTTNTITITCNQVITGLDASFIAVP